MTDNASQPTTDPSIALQEEVVQFLWRSPEPGDAGIIIGGTPSNPLKRKDLFFVVLELQRLPIDHYNSQAYATALATCLVTDRAKQDTTKEVISIQYFITADKPVPDLFTSSGLAKLSALVGGFSSRFLVDYRIIV